MPEPSEAPATGARIEPDRLYTYEEVAAFCGVKPRQVRRWVEEGKLAYTPLPGGRGRRVAGYQWVEYLRATAVPAEVA